MKKAQFEIIGLLIVVLIAVVGLGMYLAIQTSSANNAGDTSFQNERYLNGFTTSFLEADSCNTDMKSVVADAIYLDSEICGSNTSTEYLNETLTEILPETLDLYYRNYAFQFAADDTSNTLTYRKCTGNPRRIQPRIQPYPTRRFGEILINVTLCFE